MTIPTLETIFAIMIIRFIKWLLRVLSFIISCFIEIIGGDGGDGVGGGVECCELGEGACVNDSGNWVFCCNRVLLLLLLLLLWLWLWL